MSAATLRIALAQLNLLVGDIPGNAARLAQAAVNARDAHGADVILFPELSLTGYPPEDLLLRPSLDLRIEEAVATLKAVQDITLVFGLPERGAAGLLNAAWVLRDGQVLARYAKQELPNHQVFDERRYFVPGTQAAVFEQAGVHLGITICEDIWHAGPALAARAAGADLLLNLNASPFHAGKPAERHQIVARRCAETGLPVAYCNLVGGQDEL
ncbi:MAG: nitrilase-related carbon-nitrogen hydrolase, partial [Perlucidibaca sp.]